MAFLSSHLESLFSILFLLRLLTAITLILKFVEWLCQIKYTKSIKIDPTAQNSNLSWKIKKVHPLNSPEFS